MDLLGHGESTPGKDSAMDVSAAGKLKGLEKLVEEQLKDVPLIVIGRSAGIQMICVEQKRLIDWSVIKSRCDFGAGHVEKV